VLAYPNEFKWQDFSVPLNEIERYRHCDRISFETGMFPYRQMVQELPGFFGQEKLRHILSSVTGICGIWGVL